MSKLEDNIKWLAQQYKNTNIETLLKNIGKLTDQELSEIILSFNEKALIQTADGTWLNFWGFRLNTPRPGISIGQNVFSYDGASGKTFDNAPFWESNDVLIPIDDDIYRKILLSKALQLVTNGTTEDYAKILQVIFDDAFYIDNQNMTAGVILVSNLSNTILLSMIEAGVIPKSSGVLLAFIDRIVLDQDVFGFDEAQLLPGVQALGFDQASFVEQIL